jgi:serine phosphatase RsbU (regulator of sigma subunit)
VQDGMDGILICKDLQTNHMTYASSNNSPVLIRNNKLIVLPKDNMPIGKGEKTDSFELFHIDAQKGDTLYLMTDGLADQFGGLYQKKLKRKPLHQLLNSISNKPMDLQNKLIEEHFNNWKENLEQVDDVLLVGIKI